MGGLVTERDRGPSAVATARSPRGTRDLEAGQLVAFKDFWTWFSAERERGARRGLTLRAYCYAKGAEERQMKPLADASACAPRSTSSWPPTSGSTSSRSCADLVTGRSMGLKETARLAGFAWRADDSGGTLAMVNHDVAVDDTDPAGQAEARQWILEYNQDDVRATAPLREWLDTAAGELPSIADLGH